MSSTVGYFKDETGTVHLTMHITPLEYAGLRNGLREWGTPQTDAVLDLINAAHERELNKGKRDIMARFDYTEDSHGAVVDDGAR